MLKYEIIKKIDISLKLSLCVVKIGTNVDLEQTNSYPIHYEWLRNNPRMSTIEFGWFG